MSNLRNVDKNTAKEIKETIEEYFEKRGITDEVQAKLKKQFNQTKTDIKLNLIIKT